MKIIKHSDGSRTYIAGDVDEGPDDVIWMVSRYTDDAEGDTLKQDCLAHGVARNIHGAKSIIAKKCKQFEAALSQQAGKEGEGG